MESVRLSVLLIQYRKSKGLAQHDLAPEFGMSQQALGKLEQGTSLPRNRSMLRIAEATGYSMAVLEAARMAQHWWNVQKRNALATGLATAEESAPPAFLPQMPGRTSGLALVAKLSDALARDVLKPHQIDTLNTLVDSFVRDAA